MHSSEHRADIVTGPGSETAGEIQRLRTLAAVAMVVAGVTVGFVIGRTSAWFVPFGTTQIAGSDSRKAGTIATNTPTQARPAAAVPPNSAPPPPDNLSSGRPEASAAPLAAATSPPPQPSPQGVAPEPASSTPTSLTREPPKPVIPEDWRPEPASQGAGSGSAGTGGGSSGPEVKIINPSEAGARTAALPGTKADQSGPPTGAGDSEPDREAVAACEKRYSSFRNSDGTYQPYGGGSRRRCPLLR